MFHGIYTCDEKDRDEGNCEKKNVFWRRDKDTVRTQSLET